MRNVKTRVHLCTGAGREEDVAPLLRRRWGRRWLHTLRGRLFAHRAKLAETLEEEFEIVRHYDRPFICARSAKRWLLRFGADFLCMGKSVGVPPSADQRFAISGCLANRKRRWDSLLKGIIQPPRVPRRWLSSHPLEGRLRRLGTAGHRQGQPLLARREDTRHRERPLALGRS